MHLQSMRVIIISNSTVLYITAGFTFSREKHDVHPSWLMIVKSGRLWNYNICRASVMSSLDLDIDSKYHVLVCQSQTLWKAHGSLWKRRDSTSTTAFDVITADKHILPVLRASKTRLLHGLSNLEVVAFSGAHQFHDRSPFASLYVSVYSCVRAHAYVCGGDG